MRRRSRRVRAAESLRQRSCCSRGVTRTHDRAQAAAEPTNTVGSRASSGPNTPASVTGTTAPDMSCVAGGGIARITIQTTAVARPVRVSIVAPPDPSPTDGVLYLLHGAGTDETQWEAIGVQHTLDELTATNRSRPFVVVLPDLPSGGDPAVDRDALLTDVVPTVERCSGGARAPARRAVGGISRGGALALEVAADHPNEFAAVGGHSPAVSSDEIPSLARRLSTGRVPVWLDVGTDDSLRTVTTQLADARREPRGFSELWCRAGWS